MRSQRTFGVGYIGYSNFSCMYIYRIWVYIYIYSCLQYDPSIIYETVTERMAESKTVVVTMALYTS